MAAKYSRHIALTKPLASYVEDKVSRGEYASASEGGAAGLRLLMERDETRAATVHQGEHPSSHLRQSS
jgi:putative addiction module CopG family antidote